MDKRRSREGGEEKYLKVHHVGRSPLNFLRPERIEKQQVRRGRRGAGGERERGRVLEGGGGGGYLFWPSSSSYTLHTSRPELCGISFSRSCLPSLHLLPSLLISFPPLPSCLFLPSLPSLPFSLLSSSPHLSCFPPFSLLSPLPRSHVSIPPLLLPSLHPLTSSPSTQTRSSSPSDSPPPVLAC